MTTNNFVFMLEFPILYATFPVNSISSARSFMYL